MLADSGASNVPLLAGIGVGVIVVGVLLLLVLHLLMRTRGGPLLADGAADAMPESGGEDDAEPEQSEPPRS